MKTIIETTSRNLQDERPHVLRRGPGFWEITFAGQHAIFKHEPGDIQSAWLVWEDRVLALKSDFPKPRTPAQGMRALVLEIAVGGLSARAHNHSFFWFFA